jgi:Domain of unknown function (DU1801)
MAKSNAATVQDYLQELPEERRAVIAAVRDVILRNLPDGYREAMDWGVICYQVPLEDYPNTYNGKPLCYAALASQKNYFAIYLMTAYGEGKLAERLKADFKKAGKKLDMGKSCVRFRKLDDLPLEAIGRFIAAVPPKKYIAHCEAVRTR